MNESIITFLVIWTIIMITIDVILFILIYRPREGPWEREYKLWRRLEKVTEQ